VNDPTALPAVPSVAPAVSAASPTVTAIVCVMAAVEPKIDLSVSSIATGSTASSVAEQTVTVEVVSVEAI